MKLQKELKSVTTRMNIGGGDLVVIVVIILSSSKFMLSDQLSFSSKALLIFENREKRFFETKILLFCICELDN